MPLSLIYCLKDCTYTEWSLEEGLFSFIESLIFSYIQQVQKFNVCPMSLSVHKGELVVTGSADNTVRIWQWSEKESCKCKEILDHHTAKVRAVTMHSSNPELLCNSIA